MANEDEVLIYHYTDSQGLKGIIGSKTILRQMVVL